MNRLPALVSALVATLLLLLPVMTSSHADARFDYALKPQQIAPDTYLLEGKKEDFSRENGGNIVNTAFIVTDTGVVVIDTGPSKRYGEQQRAAIATVTDKAISHVYLTHHHPDHFLGNQAYSDVEIYALAGSKRGIQSEGEMFSDNMYRLIGDWMRGTQVTLPTQEVKPGKQNIGGHELEWISLDGHTAEDLVLLDHTTGVLFAGDLVFHNRAATTPHADIAHWLKTLEKLQAIPFKLIVPGHGEPAADAAPILQTRDYLLWLQQTLQEGAENGLDMIEVMQSPIPPQFSQIALVREELQRSVAHLFPALEQRVLRPIQQP